MRRRPGLIVSCLLLAAAAACIRPQESQVAQLPTLAVLNTSAIATAVPPLPVTATEAWPTRAPVPSQPSTLDSPMPSALDTATVHVVQRGETLYRIASIYNVPVEALAAANQITNLNVIYVGQPLLIPTGDLFVPAALAPTSTPVAASPTVEADTMQPLYPTARPLPPWTINDVPVSEIVVLPPGTINNSRMIYAAGQALGRNAHAFSKLGDSTIENPHFLTRFDGGPYTLGRYDYLQPVIDQFKGSFSRESVAIRRGLHSWSVFDPMWGDKSYCRPGEHMLACEIRLHNPSLLFIKLGSNDVGVPDSFDANMREIVRFCIGSGVIPILGTKADRHEGAGNINNDIVRRIAADFQVPLWDFDRVAQTLPRFGLDRDGVHLTSFFAHDYTSPLALQRGYGVSNLTALMMLDALWQQVMS